MNRLYLYGAIGLLFAGISLTAYIQTKRVGALKSELSTAEATIAAERENTRKANEASERYAISLENLKAARARTPTRSVRLCVGSGVPEAGASPGTDATGEERVSEALGSNIKASRDIGRELYGLADEADECSIQLEALQEWVRNR